MSIYGTIGFVVGAIGSMFCSSEYWQAIVAGSLLGMLIEMQVQEGRIK